MSVDAFEAILVMAVFLGAIVQGFSGFAFSAVAGAILLQVQAPGVAIPLLMICSLLIQTFVLVRLRAALSLHGSLPYLVGGAGGVVLATLVFDRIDPHVFRQCFGAFLMVYALSTVLRPQVRPADGEGAAGRPHRGGLRGRPGRRADRDAGRGARHLVRRPRHAQARSSAPSSSRSSPRCRAWRSSSCS